MTMQHTLGPWVAVGYETGLGWDVRSRSEATRVATVDGFSGDEVRQNAYLIAAAPELLALVREMAEGGHLALLRSKAVVLVAKAEGRA